MSAEHHEAGQEANHRTMNDPQYAASVRAANKYDEKIYGVLNDVALPMEEVELQVSFNPLPQEPDGKWKLRVVIKLNNEFLTLFIPNTDFTSIEEDLDTYLPTSKMAYETWCRHFRGMNNTNFDVVWNLQRNPKGRLVLPKILKKYWVETSDKEPNDL